MARALPRHATSHRLVILAGAQQRAAKSANSFVIDHPGVSGRVVRPPAPLRSAAPVHPKIPSGKRMSNPIQAAVIILWAALSACMFSTSCNLALAGPVARSNAAAPPDAAQPATQPRARAYLFRGALGPIFSRGMDRLTERLEEAGISADVYEFTICRLIADRAVRDFRDDPAPITLIGHSMGGLCALTFAEILQSKNIQVSLVVTIDPVRGSPKVPLNVDRFINIFLSDSVLGGGDVVAEQGYRGHYASFDLKEHPEITHINIDKMDSIHDQLVTAVARLATRPVQTNGEALPLRFVVPPEAPVELWDSGTPQLARSGDTLQKLATLNHVPLWSLIQANQLPDSVPLTAGQRVIVPRRLVPLVATTVGLPPKR